MRGNSVEILKFNNNEELSEKAAEVIINKINEKPKLTLGLATGSTPMQTYKNLVKAYKDGKVSFKEVITFNLDEYLGIRTTNPNSYTYFMNEHLLHHVDIDENNVHIPTGVGENSEKECAQYERLIKEEGPIDLQILGMGLNGHIAFNEPGTPITARTHVVELDETTVQANSRFFNGEKELVPTHAITMGIGTIMEAKEILFLVQGEHKAEGLRKVLYGDVTEMIPASILQKHPNVTVLTDINL